MGAAQNQLDLKGPGHSTTMTDPDAKWQSETPLQTDKKAETPVT